MDCILKVEHLTKTFISQGRENYTAVDDVNFSMDYGEKLAIIGESGSGKTTIVNMITRLLDVTSGTVYMDGEEITNLSGKALKPIYQKMQMVFQTPTESFDPRQTLGSGVAESLINHGMRRKEAMKEAENLLELCGLKKEFSKRYPHEVSGGQCQRAAIARAIAIKPKLLILDEATSALDVTTQAQIVRQMMKLRDDYHTGIIVVTHNLGVAAYMSDYIVVMKNGRMEDQGTREYILKESKNEYTRKLLEAVPSRGGERYV